MKYTIDNNMEVKPVITIEDSEQPSSSEQNNLENPVITIECDDEDDIEFLDDHHIVMGAHGWRYTWLKRIIGTIGLVILVVSVYMGVRYYNYYYNIGVSVSVSPQENIDKLAGMKVPSGKSEVVLKSDSVLGVALDMYELRHVKAEMTLEEPDTADRSVLFYTRTADYTSTGKYLGSLVIGGKTLQDDVSRLGYCAVVGGNMVIGISRSDKVKDYVEEQKGAYFRQFMLVSNGELPRQFFLHGKVERRALARTVDNKLYVIATRHAETLWDLVEEI